jgi:hypothetical protein
MEIQFYKTQLEIQFYKTKLDQTPIQRKKRKSRTSEFCQCSDGCRTKKQSSN